jgi:hypothetical protein
MAGVPGPAAESVERWCHVRGVLRKHRHELSAVAARLYPDSQRAAATNLLCRPEWLPGRPLPLDDLPLSWAPGPPPVTDGTGAVSAHVRPAAALATDSSGSAAGYVRPAGTSARPDDPYPTYTDAVAGLDRPALFENRVCYRPVAASLVGSAGIAMSHLRYFDAVNVGHAAAHELAAVWQDSPTMADLPLRALVGDPCDLARRPALLAITTLTLRRAPGGEVSFLLHWRDPAKVNHAGGLYQVMPVGVFQPITGAPAAVENDFSLWRCLARELSEELLDTPEDYETGDGVLDYRRWPFYQRLAQARREGTLSVHAVGMGVDPLTFATDILTVAVFDADVFDSLFCGLVARNAEGRVITVPGAAGIPFGAAAVDRFSGGTEPMQASGAALLRLAWQHRRSLLG